MNKKAQSQIITTVLIILLVLAAIVIVWQVVRTTVEEGAQNIVGTTACTTLDLKIESFNDGSCSGALNAAGGSLLSPQPSTKAACENAPSGVWTAGEITLRRGTGGGDLKEIRVLADDVVIGDYEISNLGELDSKTVDADIPTGTLKVEVAPRVGDNKNLCEIKSCSGDC